MLAVWCWLYCKWDEAIEFSWFACSLPAEYLRIHTRSRESDFTSGPWRAASKLFPKPPFTREGVLLFFFVQIRRSPFTGVLPTVITSYTFGSSCSGSTEAVQLTKRTTIELYRSLCSDSAFSTSTRERYVRLCSFLPSLCPVPPSTCPSKCAAKVLLRETILSIFLLSLYQLLWAWGQMFWLWQNVYVQEVLVSSTYIEHITVYSGSQGYAVRVPLKGSAIDQCYIYFR